MYELYAIDNITAILIAGTGLVVLMLIHAGIYYYVMDG